MSTATAASKIYGRLNGRPIDMSLNPSCGQLAKVVTLPLANLISMVSGTVLFVARTTTVASKAPIINDLRSIDFMRRETYENRH